MGGFDLTASGGPKGWIPLRVCPYHADLLGSGDRYITVTMLDQDHDSPRRSGEDEQ
jgi:hypothetical protein